MYSIHCLNKISEKGTSLLTDSYSLASDISEASAILVRSASMHGMDVPESLLAVARAGAGVNNIPTEELAEKGVVVFNTPGANANSVMELALCGMLLGSRDVVGGIEWVKSIRASGDVAKQVEKGKSRFAGSEIRGKKLGVIGLGAVGGPLANAAVQLGMEVYGCDPFISIDAAWHLDSRILRVNSREEIFEKCDIISLHTPLLPETKHMVNAQSIAAMVDGAIVLNFARDALVDDDAMEAALACGKITRYVTDFPNDRTAGMPGVVAIPHLGASTEEAEDNCAKMAVRQLMNYLEHGNIINSVNFPTCDMGPCRKPGRVVMLHKNIPNMISRFTTVVAKDNINISDMLNRSRGQFACTVLDLDVPTPANVVADLAGVEGVLRVRVIR